MVASGLSNHKLSTTNRYDSRRYNPQTMLGAYNTMVSLANQSGCQLENEFWAGSHDKSHMDREF